MDNHSLALIGWALIAIWMWMIVSVTSAVLNRSATKSPPDTAVGLTHHLIVGFGLTHPIWWGIYLILLSLKWLP